VLTKNLSDGNEYFNEISGCSGSDDNAIGAGDSLRPQQRATAVPSPGEVPPFGRRGRGHIAAEAR